MASHQVAVTYMPKMVVGACDTVFEVREDFVKLGDLKVSQGNIYWLPSNCTIGYELQWGQFAQLAKEHGKRVKHSS